MSDQHTLAPCVAIVGPANSGKSTILNLLDAALKRHPARPLVHVVPGSPDGTGRYLHHAPELRTALKDQVKGRWGPATVDTIRTWILNCRSSLELVLLDFGGKHAADNKTMLQACTHYLVLARTLPDPAQERAEGMQSWVDECTRCSLSPVGRLTSLLTVGEPWIIRTVDGWLEGAFRSDTSAPGDPTNGAILDALIAAIIPLAIGRPRPLYLDLDLDGGERWHFDHLADLGGHARALDELVDTGASITLGGGNTPTWAYLAAMHRVLDKRPDATLSVFAPKEAGGLVEIPAAIVPDPESPLTDQLAVGWSAERDAGVLNLQILTDDHFLRHDAFAAIGSGPLPNTPVPDGPLFTSGKAPIWLHLAYSRWLRQVAPERTIGVWDAGKRGVFFVTPREAPRFGLWEHPPIPATKPGGS